MNENRVFVSITKTTAADYNLISNFGRSREKKSSVRGNKR